MWQWALISYPLIRWSFIFALPTILAAGLQALGGSGGSEPSRFNRTHWLLLAFGVVITFSFFVVAQDKSAHVQHLFEDYVRIFITFVVSTILVQNVRQVWILYLMIAVVLGYIAYEVNINYLLKGYLGIFHNGYAGLDNNGAGLMLATGVPLCYFAWQGIDRWWRWGFIILVPGIVHSVLMTYSRGAMVAMVTVIPFLLLRLRNKWWALIFGVAMAILLPIMAGKEIRKRFFSIEKHDADATANSRRIAWEVAIDLIKENPLTGVGLRNSGRYVQKKIYNTAVHNQYLQIGADCGLPGMVLFIAVIVSTWLGLRRVRKLVAERTDPEANRLRAMANGIEGAMVVNYAGVMFLSVEVHELPYLLIFLGAQLWSLVRIQELAQSQPEPFGWESVPVPPQMRWPEPRATY
jgi:probable O-glycosylation ligase (exosortase A-associated)